MGVLSFANSGTVASMRETSDFIDMGSITLKIADADRVIVGILQDSPDRVALAVGRSDDDYYLLSCPPARARQIAASLLNKADSAESAQ